MIAFVRDYDCAIIQQVCKVCGTEHIIQAEPIEVLRYLSGVIPEKDLFPGLHEELRSLLLTSVCSDCRLGS